MTRQVFQREAFCGQNSLYLIQKTQTCPELNTPGQTVLGGNFLLPSHVFVV